MHLVKIISAIEEHEDILREKEKRQRKSLKDTIKLCDTIREELNNTTMNITWLKKARKTLGEMYDEQGD